MRSCSAPARSSSTRRGGVGYRNILNAGIPGLRMGILAPPLADGSGPARDRLGPGTYRLCAVRKQDSPDRVRELLRVLTRGIQDATLGLFSAANDRNGAAI